MTRSSANPMQEHHKKQRQKQLQKNKQKRTKERDDKVLQSKTVSGVKEEIQQLERKKKGKLQFGEEQKLQRLQKELKLLQEEEAAKVATAASTFTARPPQPQRPLTELDDPRKSVYYDAQFNPYGAPPPGKPRLYHQRGGGVTMDIRRSVVPGEEDQEEQHPPIRSEGDRRPPPRRQERPPPSSITNSNNKSTAPIIQDRSPSKQQQQHQSSRESGQKESDRKPPEDGAKERHVDSEFSTTPHPATEDEQEETQTSPSTTDNNNNNKNNYNNKQGPISVPSLPAASQAVQRSQKRWKGKSMVDIWASNEEVEYERQVNQIDVEADDVGTLKKTKKKKKKTKPPLEYFYRDQAGQVQGPFQKSEMMVWMKAGYFPLDSTMVKTTRNEEWVPIGEVPSLHQQPPQPLEQDQDDAPNSIEDRIAALKGGKHKSKGEVEVEGTKALAIQARIAALKGGVPVLGEKNHPEDDDSSVPDKEPQTVEDRIAAMKSDRQNAPPTVEGPEDYQVDVGVARYPAMARDDDVIVVAPYPVDENTRVVASYPVAEYPEVAPYSTGDDDAVDQYPGAAEYPVAPYLTGDEGDDDQAVGAYPIMEEEGAVAAYPVDDVYPIGDDLAYPVTDAYGGGNYDDNHNDGEIVTDTAVYPSSVQDTLEPAEEPQAPPKKVVKVDSQVVAFLPSHLQKKKRKAASAAAAASTAGKKSKSSTVPCGSNNNNNNSKAKMVDEDYDKFMEEIEGLE